VTISDNSQAILLLTARFFGRHEGQVRPLTAKEYGRFARWVNDQGMEPADLLTTQVSDLLAGWSDKTVTLERVGALVNRGPALALAMEKWLRSGLWIMTRCDDDYPRRLKERLGIDSPAVFFGCGGRALLDGGGLAVVGSRNAAETDLTFSRRLGALTAASGYAVISGGARGVDEASMLGALEAEGTAVGVLANGLLRACSDRKYRSFLMKNDLALVSPFNPEASFHVGNAMQRNKYIYCLADGALAVHSGRKGGTWTGGMETLKNRWVPLWVKRTGDPESGNEALAKEGAAWAPERVETIVIGDLFSREAAGITPQPGLFDESHASASSEVREEACGEQKHLDFDEA